MECFTFLRGPNVIRVLLLLELDVADSRSLPSTHRVFWLPAGHSDSIINDPGCSDSSPSHLSAKAQPRGVDDAEPYLGLSLCFFCKPWSLWREDGTVLLKMSSGALTGGDSGSICYSAVL